MYKSAVRTPVASRYTPLGRDKGNRAKTALTSRAYAGLLGSSDDQADMSTRIPGNNLHLIPHEHLCS